MTTFGREYPTSKGGHCTIRISLAGVYGLQVLAAEIDIEVPGVVVSLHKRDPNKHILMTV